jgi:hypothetical protein
MPIDIIPVIVNGRPSIDGRPLRIGMFIHIREKVDVQPGFTCIVRRYE